jgi:retron-type reverse transcriptase
MKRYGNLYAKIIDKDNIRLAHHNARKGKTFYKEVKLVDSDIERYVDEIHTMLKDGSYQISDYKTFIKNDSGKEREIFVLPYYPDRIIQWAIVQICEPIWMKSLIHQTYSSLPGRGIHQALYHLKRDIRKHPDETTYCLKFDIRKFYPSINHTILKLTIRQKIKDIRLLDLLDKIIDSTEGVPIGNYLSQFFGNLYLSEFDHWCKENMGIRYYYRYCDDIVILHNNKQYLHNLLDEIKHYLSVKVNLNLKSTYQIFPVSCRGIDFLGYRIFPNYILLRKRICKNMKQKLKRMNMFTELTNRDKNIIASYNGWLKWGNCKRLRTKYITCILCKEVIL